MTSKGQKHSAESRKRIARGTKYGQAKRRALARVAPGELLEIDPDMIIMDRPVHEILAEAEEMLMKE